MQVLTTTPLGVDAASNTDQDHLRPWRGVVLLLSFLLPHVATVGVLELTALKSAKLHVYQIAGLLGPGHSSTRPCGCFYCNLLHSYCRVGANCIPFFARIARVCHGGEPR